MKIDTTLERRIATLEVRTDPVRDREILCRLLAARRVAGEHRLVPHGRLSLRTLLTRPASIAATVITGVAIVVAALVVFGPTSSTAWAIEEAIAALRPYPVAHLVIRIPGGVVDVWSRANARGTQSDETIAHAPGGVVSWTEGGTTHHYEPRENTVYTEPVVTIGLEPWIGAELLETLARVPGTELRHRRFWLVGPEEITLTGAIASAIGPQSWVITFDARSKLPVSFRMWRNLDRNGPPAFRADEITFHAEIPESVLRVPRAATTRRIEKPLTIADQNVAVLSDPSDGIPVETVDRREAAAHLLDEFVQALVHEDFGRIRRLAPVARLWGDEFLRAALTSPENEHARIASLASVGEVINSGRSPLGPIIAVPMDTIRGDGSRVRVHMIVQFRSVGERPTCVVVGPYGHTQDLD